MKIGHIVRTNEKGQVVIPKEIREKLGIRPESVLNILTKGSSIYLYPVKEVFPSDASESSFLKILEKTRGTWKDEPSSQTTRRRVFELAASKKRKSAW